MKAVGASETSVHFNVTTRRYIPENSKLDTRRLKNLKSHGFLSFENFSLTSKLHILNIVE
jgi:hypothetical protein